MSPDEIKEREDRIAELRLILLKGKETRAQFHEYWGLREDVFNDEKYEIEDRIAENINMLNSRGSHSVPRKLLEEEYRELHRAQKEHEDNWDRASLDEEGHYELRRLEKCS